MRDYGIVSPQFWIGATGKSLRGCPEAQVLALYLMTSPHANMIGVFHCPVLYMAHETGLGIEGTSKALARLIEAEFCRYDETTEEVFVVRMAAYQIGETLDPKDKRCIGVARELEKVSSEQLRIGFRARFSIAFNLPVPCEKPAPTTSPIEAPSKPLRSQDQDQDQDQENTEAKASLPESAIPPKQSPPACPIDSLIDSFTTHLPGMPTVNRGLFKAGKGGDAMRARWRWVMTSKHERGSKKGEPLAQTAADGIAWFDRFFAYVAGSDFLTGRDGKWVACDLHWLMTASKFEAVLGGKYHTKEVAAA